MSRFSKTVSLYVDIDLDEIDTDDLLEELERRTNRYFEEHPIPNFKIREDQIKYLKRVLGLKEYHENDKVLREVKELLSIE